MFRRSYRPVLQPAGTAPQEGSPHCSWPHLLVHRLLLPAHSVGEQQMPLYVPQQVAASATDSGAARPLHPSWLPAHEIWSRVLGGAQGFLKLLGSLPANRWLCRLLTMPSDHRVNHSSCASRRLMSRFAWGSTHQELRTCPCSRKDNVKCLTLHCMITVVVLHPALTPPLLFSTPGNYYLETTRPQLETSSGARIAACLCFASTLVSALSSAFERYSFNGRAQDLSALWLICSRAGAHQLVSRGNGSLAATPHSLFPTDADPPVQHARTPPPRGLNLHSRAGEHARHIQCLHRCPATAAFCPPLLSGRVPREAHQPVDVHPTACHG
eukprot:1161505-Pelagomonas_calceolata.AAC.6